jgi:general stress protein YciG
VYTLKGFGAMAEERRKQAASAGGKAAHRDGKAHHFTSEQAREAGRKGGVTVAQRPGHMADIGRRGGIAVAKNAEHMRRISSLGGQASAAKKAAARKTDEVSS